VSPRELEEKTGRVWSLCNSKVPLKGVVVSSSSLLPFKSRKGTIAIIESGTGTHRVKRKAEISLD